MAAASNTTHGQHIAIGRTHKFWLLGALYLAQGLPFGFFSLALPVVLREAGYSLTAISALSLLYLPWALKFMWAPALDRVRSRRTWLLALQLGSVAAALLLAQLDIERSLVVILAAAFVFNIIAASQDVITDGLAVRMLDAHERGLANGIQVGAYRFGMILGGGLLLWVFARSSWSVMFTCMALLLACTVLPVLRLREQPAVVERTKADFAYLLAGWVGRLMRPGMLVMVGVIFAYRFGDQMVSTLLGPFLSDYGLNKEAIALMKGTVGSATSLIGALIGGCFTFRVSRRRALLVSGVAQAACFLLYILAALGVGNVSLLWTATVTEGIVSTIATVALFTLMMDAADPQHAGTDYTLLASVVVLVSSVANVTGAAIADAFGFAVSFSIGAVLALAGCLTLVRTLDRYAVSDRVVHAWSRRRRS